jgi:mono/diheme cytochrome c family protein
MDGFKRSELIPLTYRLPADSTQAIKRDERKWHRRCGRFFRYADFAKAWKNFFSGRSRPVYLDSANDLNSLDSNMIMPWTNFMTLAFLVLIASACSKDPEQAGQNADWQRGRAVYVANCIACHNNDPSKDGPLGPAIKGSPPELIESRVLRTDYPPGYKPKRNTQVMPTFPYLKSEIPYLVAYLSEGQPDDRRQTTGFIQQNH